MENVSEYATHHSIILYCFTFLALHVIDSQAYKDDLEVGTMMN